MAFYLTLEQVSFPSEELPFDCSSVDSLSSVVDANVDFNSTRNMKHEENAKCEGDTTGEQKLGKNVIELENVPDRTLQFESIIKDIETERSSSKECELSQASDHGAQESPHMHLLSANYPEIALPVAQYINEVNPEWCTEAEKYFKLTQMSKNSLMKEAQSCIDSHVSPFRSMAATTEALALQHSVIGSQGIKPVSPDVVAQVVARTQVKLLQQRENNNVTKKCGTNFDKDYYKGHLEQNVPRSKIPDFAAKGSHSKNKLHNDSKVPNILLSSNDSKIQDDRRSSISSINSMSSKKGVRILETDIPSVHTSQKLLKSSKVNGNTEVNSFTSVASLEQVIDSESESCLSEKLEMESICSEAFETESNVSEVSGFGEEIVQVKKLLGDLASNSGTILKRCDHIVQSKVNNSGTITPETGSQLSRIEWEEHMDKREQSTETETSELFDIMRAKANLEGRLESISKNEIDLSKERSTLQSMVTTLQAQLVIMTKQCEQAISEKQDAIKKLEFLDSQQEKWENVLKEYQNIIESKTCEIKALKEDMSELEQSSMQTRINCEELKVDMESKDGAVVGLKKKITELHVELQVLLQSKVQLQNEVKSIKHEMDMLQKSKEWYQDQLHVTQGSRDKLHKDLISLQADHVTLNNSYEKSKTEINHLRQQLNEIQQRTVSEKEVLMKHLETIEADMMERESLFDEIQRDKGSVEDALLERAKRMEEERSKLTHLMFTVSELEYQLGIVKSDICEKDKAITSLEKEKAELHKQVALLQKTVSDKDLSVQLLKQNLKDADSKISHSEMALKSVERLMDKLKEEKNVADMALASANEEKRTVNESLKVLKENLHRVENNFKHIKSELVEKTSKVGQLMKEKSILEENLKKSESNILNQQKHFQQEISLKSQNCNVIVDDIKKQKHDIENVLEVYSKDLYSYQQRIQALEQERKDLKNEVTKLKHSTIEMEKKFEILNNENEELHGEVLSLSKSIFDLKQANLGLESGNTVSSSVREGNAAIETDLHESFHRLRKEYKDKLKVYQSNIKVLIRKLKEKLKECEYLNSELNLLKAKNSNTSFPHCSTSDLSNAENELLAERKKTLQLEQELKSMGVMLKEERKHIEQNQRIIIELEKEKGKMAAIIESNDSLKLRVSELEATLAEKDATVSHISSQLKITEAELNELRSSSQSKMASLEKNIKEEKDLVKKLRQQVFQEKRANSHNQRQLSSLKSGLEQANQTADARKSEIIVLQSELDFKLQNELKHQGELQTLQTQILSHQTEVKKLKKELSEVNARDPAVAQQLKSLSWHLKEKNNEITALKEKECLLEERYKMEVDGLKKSLQHMHSEVERLKAELDTVRKQKFQYQSQLAQLRKAFKSDFKNFKATFNSPGGDVAANDNSFDLSFLDPQSSFDEAYVNNLLKKSVEISESRPLNHLQACLNSLKQEMAELQKQLCDNNETSL